MNAVWSPKTMYAQHVENRINNQDFQIKAMT